MTPEKRTFVESVIEGAKSVVGDARETTADARVAATTPVPGPGAPVVEKVAYLEASRLTVARLEAPDGTGDSRVRGIAVPLIELCRASVETHPALVDAVVEPLLAHRRTLGKG